MGSLLSRSSGVFRAVMRTLILCLSLSLTLPPQQVLAQAFVLPAPEAMLFQSQAYMPTMIRGLELHDNDLLFDFILDTGNTGVALNSSVFKKESQKLINYFLAALTIREQDMWVNLSPYEKDRMIPEGLGKTELGRDMLAQDYVLKQLTASLIYPEKELGREFWTRVYEVAQKKLGTTEIPVNTFNKVWIVADRAKVFERGNAAYVADAHLKVMLEADYKAALTSEVSQRQAVESAQDAQVGAAVLREVIIPVIEKEVNEGAHFAALRQMFHAMILASWYKAALKQAILNQVYADQNNVAGILADDPKAAEKVYNQYLQSFQQGVFNYIKEDVAAPGGTDTIPRRYFSGGIVPGKAAHPDRAEQIMNTDFSEAVGKAAVVAVRMDGARAIPTSEVGSAISQEAKNKILALLGREPRPFSLAEFQLPDERKIYLKKSSADRGDCFVRLAFDARSKKVVAQLSNPEIGPLLYQTEVNPRIFGASWKFIRDALIRSLDGNSSDQIVYLRTDDVVAKDVLSALQQERVRFDSPLESMLQDGKRKVKTSSLVIQLERIRGVAVSLYAIPGGREVQRAAAVHMWFNGKLVTKRSMILSEDVFFKPWFELRDLLARESVKRGLSADHSMVVADASQLMTLLQETDVFRKVMRDFRHELSMMIKFVDSREDAVFFKRVTGKNRADFVPTNNTAREFLTQALNGVSIKSVQLKYSFTPYQGLMIGRNLAAQIRARYPHARIDGPHQSFSHVGRYEMLIYFPSGSDAAQDDGGLALLRREFIKWKILQSDYKAFNDLLSDSSIVEYRGLWTNPSAAKNFRDFLWRYRYQIQDKWDVERIRTVVTLFNVLQGQDYPAMARMLFEEDRPLEDFELLVAASRGIKQAHKISSIVNAVSVLHGYPMYSVLVDLWIPAFEQEPVLLKDIKFLSGIALLVVGGGWQLAHAPKMSQLIEGSIIGAGVALLPVLAYAIRQNVEADKRRKEVIKEVGREIRFSGLARDMVAHARNEEIIRNRLVDLKLVFLKNQLAWERWNIEDVADEINQFFLNVQPASFQDADQAEAVINGGIDLDARKMALTTEGVRTHQSMDTRVLEGVHESGMAGVRALILRITPIDNLSARILSR